MSEDLSELLNATAKELESIVNSKTVVGAPLEVNGSTIIPLVSVGFGLGVGGGNGRPRKNESGGSGLGLGGGIRPVAVIIAGNDGVRVEAIPTSAASAAERIAETIGKATAGRLSKSED